jgi:tetratricopeptide (TPR) repeat protein
VPEHQAAAPGEADAGEAGVVSAHRTVDRLCCQYSTTPPAVLLPRAEAAARRLGAALAGRREASERRRLLVEAGWLEMLLTCLYNDLGRRESAWRSRNLALAAGRETGDHHLVAWAFETPSWFALYDGRPEVALDAALEGLRVAPHGSSGWLMLELKAASAWARLGNPSQTERHVEAAARALEGRPPPGNPQHHFVFDPPKLHSFAATAYTWLGLPARAEEHARSVIRAQQDRRGPTHNPTRLAAGRLDLAQALLEQRRLDEALAEAVRAFEMFPRRDTLVRAGELDQRLEEGDANAPQVRTFHELYLHAARSLPAGRPEAESGREPR